MDIRIKFSPLALLVCLFSQNVNSQDIKDGFIVLANGKYEYGMIQMNPTLNVYEECLFQSDRESEYKKYGPDEIKGYGVINGIHFSTSEITIDATEQKRFLKHVIDDGLANLYSYNDNRFFVKRDNLNELHKDNYKALLTEMLTSCKTISSSIKKSRFDAASLRALFIKYQRCTNPESASIPFARFQFDALAGVEFNDVVLNGYSPNLRKGELTLIDKTLFSAGFNTIVLFKKKKDLSLVTGAYYYQQNFYTSHQSVNASYSTIDNIHLDYHELLIPVALQYSFFKKEKMAMPYLKAGISIPITLKSRFIWETEQEYVNTVFFERHDIQQKYKQSLAPTVSAGAIFKLIGDIRNVLEVSYIISKGELKNDKSNFSVNSDRLVVLFGIRF